MIFLEKKTSEIRKRSDVDMDSQEITENDLSNEELELLLRRPEEVELLRSIQRY